MSKQSVTRSDLAKVLIATDVLSRGIDVPAVTLALSSVLNDMEVSS